jgi:hypothetical protein
MAQRRPVVLIGGRLKELPQADSLPGASSVTGSTTVDFGAYPGSNEASTVVSGQAGIAAGSSVQAWLVAEATSNHNVSDATYAALLAAISCSVPTADTGFTVYARSAEKLTGIFKIQWTWS